VTVVLKAQVVLPATAYENPSNLDLGLGHAPSG